MSNPPSYRIGAYGLPVKTKGADTMTINTLRATSTDSDVPQEPLDKIQKAGRDLYDALGGWRRQEIATYQVVQFIDELVNAKLELALTHHAKSVFK